MTVEARPPCPACGVPTAWTPHREEGDCLNPDCWRNWNGPRAASAKGVVEILSRELGRDRETAATKDAEAVAIPRVLAVRIVELLRERS